MILLGFALFYDRLFDFGPVGLVVQTFKKFSMRVMDLEAAMELVFATANRARNLFI